MSATLSLLRVVLAIVLKDLIDSTVQGVWNNVIKGSIFICIMIVTEITFKAITSVVSVRTSEVMSNQLRDKLFVHLTKVKWMEYSKHHSGDILTRLTSDVGIVIDGVVDLVPEIVSQGVGLITAFIILFLFDPVLAVFGLLLGPVGLLLSYLFGSKFMMIHQRAQEAESTFRSYLQETMDHMLIIKTFCIEEDSRKHFNKLQDKKKELAMKKNFATMISSSIVTFGFWLSYLAAFGWSAYRLYNNTITFGTLTAFLQLIAQIQTPFLGLASTLPQIVSTAASAERLMDLEKLELEDLKLEGLQMEGLQIERLKIDGLQMEGFKAEDELKIAELEMEELMIDGLMMDELKNDELKYDELEMEELKMDDLKNDELKCDELNNDELKMDGLEIDGLMNRKTDTSIAQIILEGVNFEYDKDRAVLRNISTTINEGDVIGLIGGSGEGKTTLFHIIMQLLQPVDGKVRFKYKNESHYRVDESIRNMISYVPQGNTLFSGTISYNLKIGNTAATEEEVIAALKGASAWEFVEKLPGGLQTIIGERGLGLSEGQAQRIAIARALLHKTPILLLDESTSALDVDTERQVLASIQEMEPKRTCIIITHRPTVLNYCQRVWKIEKGELHELPHYLKEIAIATAGSN